MSSSLNFTFNVNEPLVQNFLQNRIDNLNTGVSNDLLYTLKSSNIDINGLLLTYRSQQIIQQEKDKLKQSFVQITAFFQNNIIGTISYNLSILNNSSYITLVNNATSYVQNTSGIFNDFLNGNVHMTFDNSTGERKISIYPPF